MRSTTPKPRRAPCIAIPLALLGLITAAAWSAQAQPELVDPRPASVVAPRPQLPPAPAIQAAVQVALDQADAELKSARLMTKAGGYTALIGGGLGLGAAFATMFVHLARESRFCSEDEDCITDSGELDGTELKVVIIGSLVGLTSVAVGLSLALAGHLKARSALRRKAWHRLVPRPDVSIWRRSASFTASWTF